jgi:hypothetical protein
VGEALQATVALGATGSNFILGKSNTADARTKLTADVADPPCG